MNTIESMETGVRYIVTTPSSDGTLRVGDRIIKEPRGSVFCIDAMERVHPEEVSSISAVVMVSRDNAYLARQSKPMEFA